MASHYGAKSQVGIGGSFVSPFFYVTDLLQNIEALVRLGYGNDPRLSNALDIVQAKQDKNGQWALEYDCT